MHFKSKVKSRRVLALSIVLAMLLTLVTACSIDYAGLSEGLNDLGNAVSGYNQTPATPASEETTTEWPTTGTETSETETSMTDTSATETSSTETSATETSATETSATETSATDTYYGTEPTESTVSSSSSESEPSESTTSMYGTEPSESTTSMYGTEPSETTTEETIPTPTPTPHPTNERVDFSRLTSSSLSENFAIETEDFSESVDSEDNQQLAVFSGKRMLVGKAGSENITEAINLILDSFYQEAAGLYTRYSGEAKAAYGLTGTIDTVYNIEVNYEYSYNKRILSVIMSYNVTAGKTVIASKEECSSFDMLTGQYVTLASVASNWDALQNALKVKLAKNEPIARPSAITGLYVAAQQPGAQTATIEIYGMYEGKKVHTTGDMNEFAKYLNRYGKIIFGINEDKPNT